MSSNASPSSSSASDFVALIKLHVHRAVAWRLRNMEPTDFETNHLNRTKGGDRLDPVLRSYMSWRRSILSVAIPSLVFTSIFAFVGIFQRTDLKYYNALGRFAEIMPYFAPTFLLVGVILARVRWARIKISTKFISVAYAVSLVMPLWPTIVPVDLLLQSGFTDDELVIIRAAYAFRYIILILPVIVTLPGGQLRGALRIRGLLPESSLAAWLIIIAAPFYSVVVCVALITVSQLLGTGLLLVGTLIVVAAPLVYVVRNRIYTRSTGPQDERQVDITQRVTGLSSLFGFFLILIWAFTAKSNGVRLLGPSNDENSLLSYGDGVRLVFESYGRVLATTVYFADTFLYMTLSNWKAECIRRQNHEDFDGVFASIHDAFIAPPTRSITKEVDDSDGMPLPETTEQCDEEAPPESVEVVSQGPDGGWVASATPVPPPAQHVKRRPSISDSFVMPTTRSARALAAAKAVAEAAAEAADEESEEESDEESDEESYEEGDEESYEESYDETAEG